MRKIQIAVIISVCVLLGVFILWFKAPPAPKPEIPPAEQKAEEPQVGKYELPPAQENPEYPSAQVKTPETAPAAGETAEKKVKNTLTVEPEKPQTPEPTPSLPKKPPKMPPPEQLKKMQQNGIVAY